METRPGTNAGLSYMMGFDLAISKPDPGRIAVKAGQCRDSTNTNDIVLEESNAIWYKKRGIWGIDTGDLEKNKVYLVYAIADSLKQNPTGALISLNATGPTLPGGYNIFRRIGAVLTDASADFVLFYQCGGHNSTQRHMTFDTPIQILKNGQKTAWEPISLSQYFPNSEFMVNLLLDFTPKNVGDLLHLKRGLAVSTNGYEALIGVVAGVPVRGTIYMPTFQNQIEYFVSDPVSNADIWVMGWLDSL